jgi:hypothetical protein
VTSAVIENCFAGTFFEILMGSSCEMLYYVDRYLKPELVKPSRSEILGQNNRQSAKTLSCMGRAVGVA